MFYEELIQIGHWFKANTLSLNNRKAKFNLFHKKCPKNDLLLKLPAFKIADNKIQRKTAIKFLGAMLDKNIS